jgi:hypothetical protein
MKLFVCLVLSCALALAQFPEPSGGGGGGGGVGAVNASATCAGATTSCAVTITSLNLTTMSPALIQCKTASAIVAITGYSTAGTSPIATVTPTYTSTSNVTCTVNSNGGAGAAGATGATGTAATLAVGSTTTGSAGSSASVTNSGTSAAAVLDFTIPRGDTGAAGAAGATGPAGGNFPFTVTAANPSGACTAPALHGNTSTAGLWSCIDGSWSHHAEMALGTASLTSCAITGQFYYRTSTQELFVCDGTNFDAVGAGGGGSGDVVGPASAVDNEVAIYNSTTGKLIKRGTGCTIASAVLTCTGGFVAGDGTAESAVILKELAANGSNDFRIYGAASQSADGCLVFSGPLASGDAWRGSASTVTIDGKTCRVMETYTPSGGGGGGGSMTAGYCYMTTGCVAPQSAMANAAIAAAAMKTYVIQVTFPYSMTIAQLTAFGAAGAGAGDGVVLGAFLDSSNTPGNRIAGCAFADPTTTRTCSISLPITAGTPIWFAVAAQNTATLMRAYPGEFGAAQADQLATINRIGRCANDSTGTGASMALPASCGSLTTLAWPFPAVIGRP